MRERLIKLIKHDNCPNPYQCSSKCKYVNSDDCHSERLADYLLENGVVLPPCKVGDVVYRISGNFKGEKIYEGAVDQIVVHDNGEVVFFVYGHPLRFNKYDLGKTVFFTREDAEAKLKEGAK